MVSVIELFTISFKSLIFQAILKILNFPEIMKFSQNYLKSAKN